MDKIAAYEMLLEDHPLWTKEAGKKQISAGETLLAMGATGLGGASVGHSRAARAARGEINRANSSASASRSAMYSAEADKYVASRRARRAESARRSAEHSKNLHRRTSDMWRNIATRTVRRRGR